MPWAYASVAGLVFELHTLLQHEWNTGVEWISDIAQTDLIQLCGLKDPLERMIWAMGMEWTQLPQHCDPHYRHCEFPPGQQRIELVPKARRLVQTPSQEASFALVESDSSESPPTNQITIANF